MEAILPWRHFITTRCKIIKNNYNEITVPKTTNPKISSVLERLRQKWVKSNEKALKLPGIRSNELVPPVHWPLNGKTSKTVRIWILWAVQTTVQDVQFLAHPKYIKTRSSIVSQIQIQSETVWFRHLWCWICFVRASFPALWRIDCI